MTEASGAAGQRRGGAAAAGERGAPTISEPTGPPPRRPAAPLAWHRWLDTTPRPGYLNMAIDETLLALAEAEGAGFLRLYRWEPFCLSFGRHEPASRRYRRERIAALGLDTVRRPTGGRAVWHARELTYAVAAPESAFGSARQAYRAIHATLARAVAGLGVETRLAPAGARGAPVHAGACFAAAVGGEVMAGGRKLLGSAQLRRGSAFLQHGSLLLDGDQRVVAEVAAGPAPDGGEGSLASALGRSVSFEEIADRVALAALGWPGEWRCLTTPGPILRRAAARAGHFRSEAWTWHR
jgi:lipoate-protein ligase A